MIPTIVTLACLLAFVLGYARGVTSKRRRRERARPGFVDAAEMNAHVWDNLKARRG